MFGFTGQLKAKIESLKDELVVISAENEMLKNTNRHLASVLIKNGQLKRENEKLKARKKKATKAASKSSKKR